jgi:hypothetical protein
LSFPYFEPFVSEIVLDKENTKADNIKKSK